MLIHCILCSCIYQFQINEHDDDDDDDDRLHADLILTYKILFGHVDIDVNLFDFCSTSTRGHPFKLFKHHTKTTVHVRRFSVSAL